MNKVGLDHLEGRVGVILLMVVGVLMAPFFLAAQLVDWLGSWRRR